MTTTRCHRSGSPPGWSARSAAGPPDLHFVYDLEPSYLFHRGEITGNLEGSDLHVTATRAPGPSTSAVALSGTWGDEQITLSASVFGNLQGGFVRGSIGDSVVSVSAERRESPQGSVRVTGTWGSSAALLTLAVSAMAKFM